MSSKSFATKKASKRMLFVLVDLQGHIRFASFLLVHPNAKAFRYRTAHLFAKNDYQSFSLRKNPLSVRVPLLCYHWWTFSFAHKKLPVAGFYSKKSLRDESEHLCDAWIRRVGLRERSAKRKKTIIDSLFMVGGPSGTRTPDQPVMSRLL